MISIVFTTQHCIHRGDCLYFVTECPKTEILEHFQSCFLKIEIHVWQWISVINSLSEINDLTLRYVCFSAHNMPKKLEKWPLVLQRGFEK